ncbi:MAG: tetratricopeptide repeat protein, partial [Deltaproteobacteria bacterium]|nr:tetratricopeptide repeat protein [Deltaproteobacteria bacterium]
MTRRKLRACSVLLCLFLLAPPLLDADGGGEMDRAVALVRSGEYTAAADLLREILETDPGNREARIWLARALSFSGDFAGGEREYRTVLSTVPGDVEARIGLADVLAWQKRYREAVLVLSELAKERPDDPEVWVRKGKVALWDGNPEEAKRHFDRTLSLDPENEEARKGLELVAAKAARAYRREAEAGVAHLRIRRSTPGSQVHAAIRDRSVPGWEFLGRIDYLHRFGKDEGRGTAGVTRKWDGGGSLRVEGGISPDAEVFSRASGEAELAWPLSDRLVGYAGGKYANYSVADAWNAVGALEWYIRGGNALFARYILMRTEFDSGGSSTDGSWMAKLTHFFTDDDRLWVYYSRGTEGYTTGTADQIGNISS